MFTCNGPKQYTCNISLAPQTFSHKLKKEEGHDGPEIAHLYIDHGGRVNFNPGAFI
jgi:hypothetical protein